MTIATGWFSLRRRLLVWLLCGVATGWLGAMGYAYIEARHEIEELLETRAAGEREDEEESAHVRHELAEHFVKTLLTPLLLGLPLLGGWIGFATWRGFASLDAVARQVAQRAPERLEPITPGAAPVEIRPLLEALNGLFARMERTLDNERRFTADAAHELRTPLAGLAAQAQVALRARDAVERDHALEQIVAGSQRASHLVEQLLTLARLDPMGGLALQPVRLAELAAEVCADEAAAALKKGIALEVEANNDAMVLGDAGLLRILLRNLVDNAVRYSLPHGQVRVLVRSEGGQVSLEVIDNGPGIPVADRGRVLKRFQRLAWQDISGSGLGLSIVARIADLHGARLELMDGPGGSGLTVRLQWPNSSGK